MSYLTFTCLYLLLTSLGSAKRLHRVSVGVSVVRPRDQEYMAPEEFHLQQCGFIPDEVPPAATITLDCPGDGVRGQYLVVQILSSSSDALLTLCEVTASGSE